MRLLRRCCSPLQRVRRSRNIGHATRANSTSASSRPPFSASPSFAFTQSPNPSWKLGHGLSDAAPASREWKQDEEKGWTTFDMTTMDKVDIYRLLTSAVTPRPIAFVSSLSASGIPNLAPFSYFSMIAHNPPLISISFTLSPNKPKDTRENVLKTKEFVVNIISEPFVEAANSCSVEAPEDVDEWIVSGLTKERSTLVKPPRVRESAVSLECELFHYLDITPPNSDQVTNTLILGHIKMAHCRSAVLTPQGVVDPAKLKAVSRLGGTIYARVGEGFEIPRPSWRGIKSEVERMIAHKEPEDA